MNSAPAYYSVLWRAAMKCGMVWSALTIPQQPPELIHRPIRVAAVSLAEVQLHTPRTVAQRQRRELLRCDDVAAAEVAQHTAPTAVTLINRLRVSRRRRADGDGREKVRS